MMLGACTDATDSPAPPEPAAVAGSAADVRVSAAPATAPAAPMDGAEAPEPAADRRMPGPTASASASPPATAARPVTRATAPGGVYIARTPAPVVVINLLSPGRLEVVDGCLTVVVRGDRATAVFSPDARLRMRDGVPSAVVSEGRTIPIGEDTAIPGGGLSPTETRLVETPPASCPRLLFGLGG